MTEDISRTKVSVHTDLLSPRLPGYKWSMIQIYEDHSNWGPVQDPNLWSKFSIKIPAGAKSVQLTACPENEDMNQNPGGYLAKITDYKISPTVDDPTVDMFTFSVMWWADPWMLFIGWLVDETPVASPEVLSTEEPIPNLFESLNLENLDLNDEEASGKLFGKLFSAINRTIIQPSLDAPPGDTAQMSDRILQLLGVDGERRTAMSRKVEVKTYFMEQLATIGMQDAIVLTKERFNLPDDYSIKIDMDVVFSLPDARKTDEPVVD